MPPLASTATLVGGFALAFAALAPDHHGEPTKSDDGFTVLFDGKTLDGWVQKNGFATYRIEDGVIVGRTAAKSPNSFLTTAKDYGDFILEFDVKLPTKDLNSGVQIRSVSKPDYKNGRVHGPQVEIESSPGDAGYLYSEGTGRGWLVPMEEHTKTDLFKNGEWNTYRVEARGPNVKTFLNGEPVADLTDGESSQKGFIALQVHGYRGKAGPDGGVVMWRNIRVKEL